SALTLLVSRVTGALPIAASEVLIGMYVVWLSVAAVVAVRACIARRRRWRNASAAGAVGVARHAAIVAFVFYLFWGHNYSRGWLEQSPDWPAWRDLDPAELVALAEDALAAANAAYLELHGVPDAGAPTGLAARRDIDAALDEGYRNAAALLGLPGRAAARYGPVKFPVLGHLLIRFGIVGVYFPWTGEANVLRSLPAMQTPHTMAHE